MAEARRNWSSLEDCELMAVLARPQEADRAKTAACTEIVFRYYPEMLRRAVWELRAWNCQQPENLAEDVVQELFAVVLDKAGQFDRTRPLLPWLLTLLRHVAVGMWRREKRYRHVEHLAEHFWKRSPTPLDQLASCELLERLRPSEREVCVAFYLERRKAAEIAELIGWSAGRVYRLLYRIRARLRASEHPFFVPYSQPPRPGGRALLPRAAVGL